MSDPVFKLEEAKRSDAWWASVQEQLQTSDVLTTARIVMSMDRTLLAWTRTLLAWVRTSLALIAFGFTIYKVLSALQKGANVVLVRAQTPRNVGMFMIAVGIVSLVLAALQYKQGVNHLGGGRRVYLHPPMLAAGAVLLLGVLLLITVVANINLL